MRGDRWLPALTRRSDHLDGTWGCAFARCVAWGNEPASRCPATAPACRPRGEDPPHHLGPSRSEGRGASSGSSRENRQARAACVVTCWTQPARGRTRGPRLRSLSSPSATAVAAPARSPRPLRSDPWRPRARTHVRVPVPAAAAVAVLQQPEPVDRAGRTEPAHCHPPGPAPPRSLKPRLSRRSRPQAEGGPPATRRTALSTPLTAGTASLDPRSAPPSRGLGTLPPPP